MTDPDWNGRLAGAIQDGELRTLLAAPDTPDDEPTVAAVRQAVASIDDTVEIERHRLERAFARFDVRASIADSPSPRPLIVVRGEVDPHDADRAVAAAESIGFRRMAPSSPGPWRAYRQSHSGCALIDEERHERRIELSWEARRVPTGRFARLVVPNSSDFDAVALPERWWFGYVGIHVARLPLRLLRRRNDPAYLGPFLVTPATLIGPLLEFADARPGELVVDLGCGDGRILVAAARIGCRARGVESDARLIATARGAILAADVDDRVEVVHGDAMSAAVDDADVVILFLPVETLQELLPHVLTRLRPGARLVVHEQERLEPPTAPNRSAPLASADGVTVAHRWDR